MNEVLQKRIEEAAKKQAKKYGCSLYASGNFKDGANFILNNFWISVKEALPEEDIPNCFVAYKAMDMVLYSTGSYEKDNKEWYVDGVGFNAEVTHWMEIPSLEGGEK